MKNIRLLPIFDFCFFGNYQKEDGCLEKIDSKDFDVLGYIYSDSYVVPFENLEYLCVEDFFLDFKIYSNDYNSYVYFL